MIRLDFMMRRRSGMSPQEFSSYWRDQHGPIAARGCLGGLRAQRYIQTHTTDDPLGAGMREQRPGMHEPFDGYASIWWANRADLEAAFTSPEGKEAMGEIMADSQKFVDLERSPMWISVELPQVNPPDERAIVAAPSSPTAKLIFILQPKQGLTDPDCQRYWMTAHAGLARRYAAAMGFIRYLQVHRLLDEPLSQGLPPSAKAEPYVGIAEVWADRVGLQSLMGTPPSAGAQGFGLLAEDELRFMEMSRCSAWVAHELVFVDRR